MVLSPRFSVRAVSLAVAAVSASLSMNASASIDNLGTTYGVMPIDVATAQSLSMFNDEVSATYYNPASLTKNTRGERTTVILHAEQELRSANPKPKGEVLADSPSQAVQTGRKSYSCSLTARN